MDLDNYCTDSDKYVQTITVHVMINIDLSISVH